MMTLLSNEVGKIIFLFMLNDFFIVVLLLFRESKENKKV